MRSLLTACRTQPFTGCLQKPATSEPTESLVPSPQGSYSLGKETEKQIEKCTASKVFWESKKESCHPPTHTQPPATPERRVDGNVPEGREVGCNSLAFEALPDLGPTDCPRSLSCRVKSISCAYPRSPVRLCSRLQGTWEQYTMCPLHPCPQRPVQSPAEGSYE